MQQQQTFPLYEDTFRPCRMGLLIFYVYIRFEYEQLKSTGHLLLFIELAALIFYERRLF